MPEHPQSRRAVRAEARHATLQLTAVTQPWADSAARSAARSAVRDRRRTRRPLRPCMVVLL